MENSKPKFVLPPPKFNNDKTDTFKSALHYLTPCGMTLLPRSKQPPPMYGARGATVPAKYLQSDNNSAQQNDSAPPIYEPPPEPEYCNNCEITLASSHDMKRHLEQHNLCPVDNCDFAALESILDRHIEQMHITGLYKKVKKVWTPEQIAEWRNERRKRFPTAANVELAKKAKEQRIQRGERLEASKARFGKPADRRQMQSRDDNNKSKRQPKRKKARPKPKPRDQYNGEKSSSPLEINSKEGKVETKEEQLTVRCSTSGVPMFCGTMQMSNYKHLPRKSDIQANALSSLVGMYGSDSEDEEEDEEMEVTDVEIKEEVAAINLEVKEEIEATSVEDEVKDKCITNSNHSIPEEAPIKEVTNPSDNESIHSSDDEAPDEMPIEKCTEKMPLDVVTESTSLLPNEAPLEQPKSAELKPTNRTDKRTKPTVVKTVQRKPRVYGLNFKRAKQLSKQNTMLEKLLAPEILHERNVLLQCVRFVCEQNFFGIGGSNLQSKNKS